MASIATPLIAKIPQLRPLNIMRDLPGVADLVEKCFSDTMDAEGRSYIQQMRRAGKDNVFLRWASRTVETAYLPLSGYIWEENGELIGNVSLIPYHHARKKYYLIANVAVRPEFRKRGIGRALTVAAMHHARQHHAYETWLHVRDDNTGAIDLYRSLGFVEYARRTSWQSRPDRNHSSFQTGFVITKRTTRDWLEQENWLRRLYPDLLSWYQPMPWFSLRPGLIPAFYRFLSDINVHHWVARTGTGETGLLVNSSTCAVVSWQTMTGHNHRIWSAVPPKDSEEMFTALLLHIRQGIPKDEKINLDFPSGQYCASIEAAGFQPSRTLLWMKSNET